MIAKVKSDDKHRVTLKKVKKIRKNQVALPSSVKKGLVESAAGKLVKRPSYAKHAHDELG